MTCGKDSIIKENEEYKAIRLQIFNSDFLNKRRVGGARYVIDRYPYLKHIIELKTGYWEYQLENINEFVGEKN